jgi:hypothetical protein
LEDDVTEFKQLEPKSQAPNLTKLGNKATNLIAIRRKMIAWRSEKLD